jgi:hypothetical protein
LDRLVHFRRNQKDREAREAWTQLRQAVLYHKFSDPVVLATDAVWPVTHCADGVILHSEDWKVYPPGTKSYALKRWDVNGIYRLIARNDFVRDHFEKKGIPLAFPGNPPYIFTPYIHQSVLSGVIGEEAVEAILIEAGFETETVPDLLFETIDLKIAGHPWYIDCKNFTERTMDNFYLTVESPGHSDKLNVDYFTKSAARKLTAIRDYHTGELCKLIYMNLASDDDRAIQFFDSSFQECHSFASADIVIVQGILRRAAPNEFHTDFLMLIRDMQSY